jgi:hypothetical protein
MAVTEHLVLACALSDSCEIHAANTIDQSTSWGFRPHRREFAEFGDRRM